MGAGKKSSIAKISAIIGAIFGLLGIFAGFYFGVLAPALANGQLQALSARSRWAGGMMLVALVVVCGFYLWRWLRGPQQPPKAQHDEW